MEQFRHQLMKMIPQGHLDHPLEYLIKTMGIISQKPRGKLNEVQYKTTGKIMKSVAKKHDDDSVLRRLNSIVASDDYVASDTKYHLKSGYL